MKNFFRNAISITMLLLLITSSVMTFTSISSASLTAYGLEENEESTDSTAAEVSEQETAEDRYIEELLGDMTTDEKIAQLILARRPSEDAGDKQEKYQYGGFILFSRDFKNNTPERLSKAIERYQSVSKVNMLIAVDEEGGDVVRASQYSQFRKTPFKSQRKIYSKKGYKGLISDTADKDEFLLSLGINTNLAPVADVTYSKSDYMYSRAVSNNADKAADLIAYQVRQMNDDNVVSTLKHFPGYGNNSDTHGGVARDKRSIKTFTSRDLKTFAAGIEEGADMVMLSHTIVNAFDKKRPASISPKVCDYLRDEMGFDGVIITDGLAMNGIKDFVDGDEGDAAVLAVKAGCDMVCADNNAVTVLKKLKKAVNNGEISEERVDESVRRILKMKIDNGIIDMSEEEEESKSIDDKLLMYIAMEEL